MKCLLGILCIDYNYLYHYEDSTTTQRSEECKNAADKISLKNGTPLNVECVTPIRGTMSIPRTIWTYQCLMNDLIFSKEDYVETHQMYCYSFT